MAKRQIKLTAHFKLWEFRDWHTGHLPPPESIPGLRNLCQNVLEPLRTHYGPCVVHSGYREPSTNKTVGGAPHSFHLYKEHPHYPAADVTFHRGDPYHWAQDAARLLRAGGIGEYRTHVHIDCRPTRARW